MSAELIAIISMGLGLAVLVVGLFAWLRADVAALRNEIREEFSGIRGEIGGLRGEITELRGEVTQLRERMAHLEGLLEGLREAIAVRVPS